ncbi:MAG: hypothetical protein JWN50_463 [Parcubacteria group bacterium]|nr:hypothetical protein [Parcubacteria group bacterium]
MKKVLFGIVAIVIVAAGTNYAIQVAARSSADDASYANAATAANDLRIQQRDIRVQSQKARALRVDTSATKKPTPAPAATTTIKH